MDVIAGWYPDPEDPTKLRWWDGSAWTDHRQSVDGTDAAGHVGDDTAGSAEAPTLVDTPAVGDDTQTMPAHEVPDAPASPVVDVPTAPPAEPGRSRSRTKPLLLAAAVVVVLVLGVGAFLFLGGENPTYTWDGEQIADLEATLADADDAFIDGVEERRGSVTDDSRCYVVQDAADGAENPSDLLGFLRCGPVLFVDDDPEDGVWLTYALSAEENDDGDIVLTAAGEPQSPEPEGFDPDVEKLSRPDDLSPPDGDGGVESPDLPRAEAGIRLSGDPLLDDIELDSAAVRAVGLTKSVELVGVAEPERYGTGDDARRPAEGERFVAFELLVGQGDSHYGSAAEQTLAATTSSATVTLDVDGDKTVLVAGDDADPDARFLVSIPTDAVAVDLVLVDSDVSQRISVLTQEVGDSNIDVLARTTRDAAVDASKTFPVTITHADGSVQNDTFTVTVEGVELLYYVDDVPDRLPSGPGKAFLIVHHFITSEATGITEEDDIGLEPGHLHLQMPGDDVVEAINLAPDDGDILLAFEVPGTFEEATLVVRGAASSGDIEIDLGNPGFRTPISIENR